MPLQLEVFSVVQLVASVILYYDYLLTLRREVDFFWMKPHGSWMFALFVANRYITLLGRVPTMVGRFWPRSRGEDDTVLHPTNASYSSCKIVVVYDQWVIIAVQIIGGIIMIIRVYALYMKSRRVLLFLVAVILAGIGVGCWALLSALPATARPVPTPPLRYGCNVPTSYEKAERFAIAWSTQLVFDAVVFVLTLWRTLRSLRLGNRALLDSFIRDGALYFGLMTGVNAANITAILVFNTSATKLLLSGSTNVISSTMVSRLMLNLRDPKIMMSSQPMMPIAHYRKHNSVFEPPTTDDPERDTYYVAED
ncbi:hypothetical protein EDC04DRAFT_2995445 [Pisolithus marmoratus]|nr:hypothetical protein EDC04DRAFT_2995445 [Pisolithus marmoratus]